MTEPKLPAEPTPLLLILLRLEAGDHTVIPDDVEPTLWMREQIGLAANALTSALARVADMEGEIELINGQLRYVMKSNEANFNRAEAANARAEAVEANDRRYRQVKQLTKEQLFFWRGAYGCSDEAIDAMVKS